MRKAKFITIIIIFFTTVFFLFAVPAINLSIFGLKFKADGLNLSTITKGRYKGEINFSDGLDINGGKKYHFTVNFKDELKNYYSDDASKNLDLNAVSQKSLYKFADRLSKIGFKDFDLKWYIEDNSKLNVDLLLANNKDSIEEIVPLLAGKGDISFYSQDPDYTPEKTDDNRQFNLFEGIKKTEITRDDIDSFKSIYSSKVNGYGFKIVFKKEAKSKLLGYIQQETAKGTMLFIDGQPVAVRSFQVENLFDSSSKKPVMYMTSFFSDNLFIDDVMEIIYKTGPLEFDIKFNNKKSIDPVLGLNFVSAFKITLFMSFFALTMLLFYKYRILGLYFLFANFVYGIFNLFILKLFSASLTLPLILGQIFAFMLFVIININILSDVKNINVNRDKELSVFIREKLIAYRNLLVLLLGVIMIFAFVAVGELSFLSNGFGVGLVVAMILKYLLMYGPFKLFVRNFK